MSVGQYVPDIALGTWDRSVQESRQKFLPLWQNIPADLKINLHLLSQPYQVSYKHSKSLSVM